MKLTLKQGFVLIDETCTKHATVLEGLQSLGHKSEQIKRFKKTLHRVSGQLSVAQQRTLELQKDTSLDWRIQSIEDHLSKLQRNTQAGVPKESQDQTLENLVRQAQDLQQNPLWHEMQVTAAEARQVKEKLLP